MNQRKRKIEAEIDNAAIKALFDSKIENLIFKKFAYRLYDRFHNAVNKSKSFRFTNVYRQEYKYLNQELTKEEKELLGLTLNYDDKHDWYSFVIDSSKGKVISKFVGEYYLSNDRLKTPEQEEQQHPGYQIPPQTIVFVPDFPEVEQTDNEPEITFFPEPDQTSTDSNLQFDIDKLIADDNGINFDFPEQTSAEESKSDITSQENTEFNIETFFHSKINDWLFKHFLDRLNSRMEIFDDKRKLITVCVTIEIYEYFKNLIEKEPRIERYLKIESNTNHSYFIKLNMNAAVELNRLSGPYLVKQKPYVSNSMAQLKKPRVNHSKLFQNSKIVPAESPAGELDPEWKEFLRKHI